MFVVKRCDRYTCLALRKKITYKKLIRCDRCLYQRGVTGDCIREV